MVNKMKVRIFWGMPNEVEKNLNYFISTDPDIDIIHTSQSASPTGRIFLVIFYKKV
jgi:hypothetical protein